MASVHSHSVCSREKLSFIPEFTRRIPFLAHRLDQSLGAYERHHGEPLDFANVCWRPPLSPAAVVASEREQAARRFELPALVSLTDHDTLEGPRALRVAGQSEIPLSLEWSAPYEGSMFHLGVHAISPARVQEIERALAAYTALRAGALAPLLSVLAECRETVVVLNHPFWDLARIGQLRHDANLIAFLRRHGDWIHGLELNGYRTWTENRRVLSLASGFSLPLVGGGDRHGYVPNGIVNLTHATTLAGFAEELRVDRVSHCVVMPEYAQPFVSRVIETATDILRRDARSGGRSWDERVFITARGRETPVCTLWRPPAWVQASVAAMQILNSTPARMAFRLSRADGAETLRADCTAEPLPQPAAYPWPVEPSAAA